MVDTYSRHWTSVEGGSGAVGGAVCHVVAPGVCCAGSAGWREYSRAVSALWGLSGDGMHGPRADCRRRRGGNGGGRVAAAAIVRGKPRAVTGVRVGLRGGQGPRGG